MNKTVELNKFNDGNCAICWLDIDNKNYCNLTCGHSFHTSCMILSSIDKCPLCSFTITRGNIPKRETSGWDYIMEKYPLHEVKKILEDHYLKEEQRIRNIIQRRKERKEREEKEKERREAEEKLEKERIEAEKASKELGILVDYRKSRTKWSNFSKICKSERKVPWEVAEILKDKFDINYYIDNNDNGAIYFDGIFEGFFAYLEFKNALLKC